MDPNVLRQKVSSCHVVGAVRAAEWQSFGFVELPVVHQLRTTSALKGT